MTNSAEIIATAIAPLRDAAIAEAGDRIARKILAAFSQLQEAGWDLQAVAPRARYCSREEYRRAADKRAFFCSITKRAESQPAHDDNLREVDGDGVERCIALAKEIAAASYDAYAAKMIAKLGEVTFATLSPCNGSGLWEYSILNVVGADGVGRCWKTQRIVNFSSLGKPFFQWPTRELKKAA